MSRDTSDVFPTPGAPAIAEPRYPWTADGRRVNEPTTDDQNAPGAGVLLIDRRGIIRYAADESGRVVEVNEMVLDSSSYVLDYVIPS